MCNINYALQQRVSTSKSHHQDDSCKSKHVVKHN
jgi:hypothetical protein